jgi:hypothetical protein
MVKNASAMSARTSLRDLDRLMRERVSLSPAPVPPPLHKMGQRDDKDQDNDQDNDTMTGQRP